MRIELLRRGPVAEIRLNRPEALNALGPDWPANLLAAVDDAATDPAIRVVLLTAAGRAFCAGADLTELAGGKMTPQVFHDHEIALRALETMDKPVIAGIHGYCIGGGLQIAIACDVRIAADDAVLGLPAAKEAFLPGMSLWRLPRLIGMGHARHLIFSGRNVRPDEAYRIGLVNAVVPRNSLEGELDSWAARYLEVPTITLKWAKRLTNEAFELSFEDFLEKFDAAQELVLGSAEHQAARRAWLARKAGGSRGAA